MEDFKNIFSRPLFIIIFRPEMLTFHPYSILTGDTRVEFVIYGVLKISFIVFIVITIALIFQNDKTYNQAYNYRTLERIGI